MGGTTANGKLPYPVGTDRVMDGDNAMQSLAEAVDGLVICYAQVYRAVTTQSATTGNIWWTDLTVGRKAGNINADASGIVVNVAGDYEVIATVRQQATAGTNVILAAHAGLNAGSTPIAVGTVIAPISGAVGAGPYWTSIGHNFVSLAAGDRVNFGNFQAAASNTSIVASASNTNLTVRLLKAA